MIMGSNPTHQNLLIVVAVIVNFIINSVEEFIQIDCVKFAGYNLKVLHRRHICKHRFINNIPHIKVGMFISIFVQSFIFLKPVVHQLSVKATTFARAPYCCFIFCKILP
jgi:hypothetical protein